MFSVHGKNNHFVSIEIILGLLRVLSLVWSQLLEGIEKKEIF